MKPKWSESLKILMLALMLAGGAAALTACEEGGFEEAGEEIDEAAEEAGEEIDEAADEAEDEL